jgi:hypothetical protein
VTEFAFVSLRDDGRAVRHHINRVLSGSSVRVVCFVPPHGITAIETDHHDDHDDRRDR